MSLHLKSVCRTVSEAPQQFSVPAAGPLSVDEAVQVLRLRRRTMGQSLPSRPATASAGNIEYVRSLGADVVIDYKATPFEEVVSDVDVVLDPIGGRTAEASLDVLNDGGSLISLAGPPAVTLPEGRDLSARFFIVEPERSQLIELARLVDDGRLRVEVAEVFPLEDAAAAYEYGRTGRRRGKVVVQVGRS
jgi:NADPH:quinone reductase-like Zn-dependent oxidoreductase